MGGGVEVIVGVGVTTAACVGGGVEAIVGAEVTTVASVGCGVETGLTGESVGVSVVAFVGELVGSSVAAGCVGGGVNSGTGVGKFVGDVVGGSVGASVSSSMRVPGCPATYRKPLAKLSASAPFETVTSTAPTPKGSVHSISVGDDVVTGQSFPPIVTTAVPVPKLFP